MVSGSHVTIVMVTGSHGYCVALQVKVTDRVTPDSPEITIRELKKGAFFGEKALLG